MKSLASLFALTALLASMSVHAAPAANHTSAAHSAGHASAADAELTHKGRVISAINAEEYTYIEVAQGKNTLWLAAPTVAVKKDNIVRFEDGAMMTNFRSKLLNRTFPSVMFVSRVVVTKE